MYTLWEGFGIYVIKSYENLILSVINTLFDYVTAYEIVIQKDVRLNFPEDQ
ncbi:hypothetical protein GA0061102_102919 [Rhizobium miluonense]|uniref:Uncharacterized protein n=1 Tax=Rhizobium miluonense TaxID=411945 RepID=A0A1C3WFU2_9HYPH|nr:hypothetical protein GA0061102_102919 [Rhizobium miluonense]